MSASDHIGIQWDKFHAIPEELESYLGTNAIDSRESWVHDAKYPHKYLSDATHEDNPEHYQVLQERLKDAGVPDQVQVTRRGTPVNRGSYRNGSIYPEWSGGNAQGGAHYGRDRKLFTSLIPREHIVALGQEEEGEVFYKTQH